jgi:hypothetical protein
VWRGGPALPLLVELVAVEQVESLAYPRLREVVVETIRRHDRGAGEPVERVPHAVVLPLGECFLYDLAKLVEAKVDLLALGLLLFVAVEEGDEDVVAVGRRETVFVGAEDRPALLDHGSLVVGDPLGEAGGLAVTRNAVREDREWILREIHFIFAKDDGGEESNLGFWLLHALSSPTRSVCYKS